MASFHLSLKRGARGKAARHSNYIARRGEFSQLAGRGDLMYTGCGNLPGWTNGDPRVLWRASDRYERANGMAYIEFELALPAELASAQQLELVKRFIQIEGRGRPFEFAVHCPQGSVAGLPQPHAHVMFSNRLPDAVERTPEQHFQRFNRKSPELGGCFKEGAGIPISEMTNRLRATRKLWAELQNESLCHHGHMARVDHRSYKERGIGREPEQHLGSFRVSQMTDADRGILLKARAQI